MQLRPQTASSMTCYDLHPRVPQKQEISHYTPRGTFDSDFAHNNLIMTGWWRAVSTNCVPL